MNEVMNDIEIIKAQTTKIHDVDFEHLNIVFSGGEVVTFDLIDVVREVAPNAVYYNMYGPTEVTMNCLYTRIDNSQRETHDHETVPTGRLLPHLEAKRLTLRLTVHLFVHALYLHESIHHPL